MYYVIDDDLMYILRFSDLRRQIPRWYKRYAEGAILNHGYHTKGVLVPLYEFKRLAMEVHVV